MRIFRTVVLTVAMSAAWACTPVPPLKEYAYPSWGFAVSFRGPPKVTDSPAASDGSTVHTLLVESSLAGLRDAAVRPESSATNLMPHFIRCAEAYATLGEQCAVLRSVFGEYREPVFI